MNKKRLKAELRNVLAKNDEYCKELHRLQARNRALVAEVKSLEVMGDLQESQIEAAESAIRHHETKFNNSAEFTANMMRFMNED